MRAHILGLMLAAIAGQASALTLSECTRTTHISHGGEAGHRDLGEGRVAWLDWWSQEGMAHDIMIVECASGEMLRFRTAEENMSARAPFHKTDEAVQIVNDQHLASRVFATLPRIAEAVGDVARDVTLGSLEQEPCACAALYPELRGNKEDFKLGG